MHVRDNVRERRRNRIRQLTGVRSESWSPEEAAADKDSYGAIPDMARRDALAEAIRTSPNLLPSKGAKRMVASATPEADAEPADSLAALNAWFEATSAEAGGSSRSATSLDTWLESAASSSGGSQWNGGRPQERNDSTIPSAGRASGAAPEPILWPDAGPPPYAPETLTPLPIEAPDEEPDPEKWWKERQRLQFSNRAPSGDAGRTALGTGPIKRLSDYPGLVRGPAEWNEGPSSSPPGGALRRFLRGFALRTAVALLLLGGAWAWFRFELPGSEAAQAWTVQALTKDIDYIAVQEWYEKKFGSTPAFLHLLNRSDNTQAVTASWSREDIAVPLAGKIVRTFGQDGEGIRMSAPSGSPVRAVHSGRVTRVARDDQGFATVEIQHPNRVVSIYGNVDNAAVKENDWVETGASLGEAAADESGEGAFYFALKQNGRSLDPSEVIPFD
ncbi:M23 family metallopeptidase [Cohnella sp. AR92]|uniref:M23 family metallopeptidase n=1 Tax=Cohnella sp. AR92 TaxID=648716 RepID=UPI0013156BAF|nr:M23 family metallopeptidase [Cohnella sp. AR92]